MVFNFCTFFKFSSLIFRKPETDPKKEETDQQTENLKTFFENRERTQKKEETDPKKRETNQM